MHIRVLAVGERQPTWVNEAFADYAGRLPREWRFQLQTIPGAARGKRPDAVVTVRREGAAMLAAIKPAEFVVALDERGEQHSSVGLANKLCSWQSDGRDVCLLIGGADGLSDEVYSRSNQRLALSRLTLPHGLVRVILAEQLYRAWSLRAGHPYHRA